MQTICVANQKGGVGKTTTVINLAAELGAGADSKRVLCVDMDAQGTLTMAAGYGDLAEEESIAALLSPRRPAVAVEPLPAPWGGEILAAPARQLLSQTEMELGRQTAFGVNERLRGALSLFADRFDIALVDTPPSLGRLTANALVASEWALVPVSPDYFSIGGLDLMIELIDNARVENPELKLLGIFPSIVFPKTLNAQEWRKELEREYGADWIDIAVPHTVKMRDAQQTEGVAVRSFDSRSKASHAYRMLARETLKRIAAAPAVGLPAVQHG